jgi:hypothetical protein
MRLRERKSESRRKRRESLIGQGEKVQRRLRWLVALVGVLCLWLIPSRTWWSDVMDMQEHAAAGPDRGSAIGAPAASAAANPETSGEGGHGRRKVAPSGEGSSAGEGYSAITFDTLQELDVSAKDPRRWRIPPSLQALDGQKVAITGYMIPVAMSGDSVGAFALVRSQMFCCYGRTPQMNEWVYAQSDPPVPPVTDVPLAVRGTLKISPQVEGGRAICLYRLQVEDVEVAP